jgi:hypothetical protein
VKIAARSIVLVATAVVVLAAAVPASAAKSFARGYDVSWPQCGDTLPTDGAFGIVGVNGGRPFDHNACLADQYDWAAALPGEPAFYANSANPGTLSTRWTWSGPKPCGGGNDDLGCAYNYGWNAATDAFGYANTETGAAALHIWWIDVEIGNSWSSNTTSNIEILRGMRDYLSSRGVVIGFYSTGYQWGEITGGTKAFASHRSWLAGARNATDAKRKCSRSYAFTGGGVALVQYVANNLDNNISCL